jgi:hypothetical protein
VRRVAVLAVDEIVMIAVGDAFVPAPADVDMHVRLVRQMRVAGAPMMVAPVPATRGALAFGHDGTVADDPGLDRASLVVADACRGPFASAMM